MADTTQERFDEIWQSWGLTSADEQGALSRRKALAAVKVWLEKAAEADVLRATQVLLLNPETPGAHKRECVKAVVKVIQADWAGANAAQRQDLQFIQAMVLAAWPQAQRPAHGVASLLDSAFGVTAGRDNQREELEAWLRRPQTAAPQTGTTQTTIGAPRLTASLSGTLPVLALSEPEVQQLQTDSADGGGLNVHSRDFLHTYRGGGRSQIFSDTVYNVFNELNSRSIKTISATAAALSLLQTAVNQTRTEVSGLLASSLETLAGHLNTQLTALTQQLNTRLTELAGRRPPSELELLWWGQARYCFTRGVPYRRMKDPSEVLWCAASEVAARALDLATLPSAAYLEETLHALGYTLTDAAPLERWALDLFRALRGAGQDAPGVNPALAALADADPSFLPVTWLRLRARAGAREDQILGELAERCLSPLQAELDRGDWATWVLREWLLDRRWPQGK